MEEIKVARWKQRIFVVEAIYSELLIKNNSWENIHNFDVWKEFEKTVFQNYLNNKEKYINEVQKLLKKGWTVDRLNVVLLALMLEVVAEFHEIGTKSQILLQQAVITSKTYCNDDEYKLVNALLENYLKQF